MIDPKEFKVQLITSEDCFRRFAQMVLESGYYSDGVDTETNGWDFTTDSMAGFSLSSHVLLKTVYVPLDHDCLSLDLAEILPSLQAILDKCEIIFHGSTYDMLFLCRQGLKFKRTKCTYILANMMQARNGGLKDLVLEYGLVNFRDVITYIDLIKKVFNLGDTIIKKLQKKEDDQMKLQYSFGKIDLIEYPEAVEYACNDAVWAEAIYGYMAADIRQRIDGLDQETVNPF